MSMKEFDISAELYREVVTSRGVYRIDSPIKLFIREGGSTHRVLDANGMVHCYGAPEVTGTILRWKPRDLSKPVQF